MATELARCLTRGKEDELFQLAQYSLGEVIANVKQHAERVGFVCAQSFKKHEMSRIGIADCGIGLGESFRRTDSPRFREGMNDLQVLELAMSPYGSSKAHLRTGPYGETANKGVGLTMIRFMAAQSYGHFFLASGKAWWYRDGLRPEISSTFPAEVSVHGTVVGVAFQRSQVDDYLKLRRLAWDALGLTEKPADTKLFT
jgi:hypothetical protein